MPQFLFVYHGGKRPESEEEYNQVMAEWGAWFASMGESLAIPGNPVGMSKTVSRGGVADNGGANPVSGFTVIEAADIDAAIQTAKGCPMVVHNVGSVEVAEITPLM